jgi:radical SAM superfamily enzyme YgiQ (UPF0313 family)
MLHSKYIHSGLAPWYLAAGVEAFGCEDIHCEVTEGTVNEPEDDILLRIESACPDILGFCCYIWNIEEVKKLAAKIHARMPAVKIVLGGPEVSGNATELLQESPSVFCVLAGEGEETFPLLLDLLRKNESLSSLPGACFRNAAGGIFCNEPPVPKGNPPSPYSKAYFESLRGRIAYIETSRGCPYSCAFCLSGIGKNVRYFDLQRAKEEMIQLANSRSKTIKFVDRTFNADAGRAREIFDFLIRSHARKEVPQDSCFHFEIAGDLLDEKTMQLLSQAPGGLFQFEIGFQSFNANTLIRVHRKTDIEILKQNIARLVDMGNIHIHVDLIAGLPLENLKSFAEGFNTAYSLKPHMLQLGFLKMLHGARMRQNPEMFPCRYSPKPPYEVLETPWMSEEELAMLHCALAALDRLANRGRFHRTLNYLIGRTKTDAFSLFMNFGCAAVEDIRAGISLDGLLSLFFRHSCGKEGVDAKMLRDLIICDCLATGRQRQIPASLRRPSYEPEDWQAGFDKALRKALPKVEKTALARIFSVPGIVVADYSERNPVTGEYPIVIYVVDAEWLTAAHRLFGNALPVNIKKI